MMGLIDPRACLLVPCLLHLLRPLHPAHARHAAQAEDHAIQVAHILGFHHKLDNRFAVFVTLQFHAANVGVLVGDHGGQFLQHPGTVVAVRR